MTYYDILGIPTTATKAEIKQAYLSLAKEFHPDKSAGVNPAVRKLVEEKFKDIQEAFEILSKHRNEYDNQLRPVAPSPPPPPPKQSRTPPHAAPTTAPTQSYVPPKAPKYPLKGAAWAIGAIVLAMTWWGSTNDTNNPAATAPTEPIARFQTPAPMADEHGFCGTAGYPDCKPNAAPVVNPMIHKERVPTAPEIVSQTNWATVKTRYGASIFKRCHFNVGNVAQRCGSYLDTEEIARIKFGDKVRILSMEIRASGGGDIYEVRFQQWTGWMDAADLSDITADIVTRTPRRSKATEADKAESVTLTEEKVNEEVSSQTWKHFGSNNPERLAVWINQNHLYESAEPWTAPSQDNIKNSTQCYTVKGAPAKLGPTGLYAGECTYTIAWVEEGTTCIIKTEEIITSISPTGLLGWSQRIDYSPLGRGSCPVAGKDGAAFAYEPASAKTDVASVDQNIPKQRVCIKGTEICSDAPPGEPKISKQRICIKGTEICSDAK